MRGRINSVAVAILVVMMAAVTASGQIVCVPGGAPTVVVTAARAPEWSGAWEKTAAELVGTKLKNGTATLLQTMVDDRPVEVIVWVWFSPDQCGPHPLPLPPTPPASTDGWKVEAFNTMMEAAARYDSLAVTNGSTRLVSSIWGGVGFQSTRGGVTTHTSFFAPVAWVVYYDRRERGEAAAALTR